MTCRFENPQTTMFRYSRWKTLFTRVGELYMRLDTLSHDVRHRHYSLSIRVGPALWPPVQLSCVQSGGMGVSSTVL